MDGTMMSIAFDMTGGTVTAISTAIINARSVRLITLPALSARCRA
jgi:hypothetical protein